MVAWSRKRRAVVVSVLLALALGLRVGEVERTAYRPMNDAVLYLRLASQIAHTGDYSNQVRFGGVAGSRGPTAYFPPAFPYFLAAVDLIDGHTGLGDGAVQPARVSQAVVGTAIVAVVGLVGFEAFGELVGMIALGLAAIYPVLIELSATLVAENLMTLLILAAIWAALRAGRAERRPFLWIALAGVLTGLATLTHVNSIVLLVPLGIAAWRVAPARHSSSARGRAPAVALLVGCTLLALAPWLVRDAVELHQFVPVADETGYTLVGTYNPASAADHQIPYRWRAFYKIPGEPSIIHPAVLTETALDSRLQSQALRYIGNHPLAPLSVLYHNTRRLLELERTFTWEASASSIGIPVATARIAIYSFWALCVLALIGVFTPAAGRAPWWLWLVPVLLWLSVALINAETPRFREPIDPFLILLGACTLAEGARAAAGRLVAPGGGHRRAPIAAGPGQLVEVRQRLA